MKQLGFTVAAVMVENQLHGAGPAGLWRVWLSSNKSMRVPLLMHVSLQARVPLWGACQSRREYVLKACMGFRGVVDLESNAFRL